MKKVSIFKKIAAFGIGFAFMAIVFSSCHRGSGCPGKITDRPNQSINLEANIDNHCDS